MKTFIWSKKVANTVVVLVIVSFLVSCNEQGTGVIDENQAGLNYKTAIPDVSEIKGIYGGSNPFYASFNVRDYSFPENNSPLVFQNNWDSNTYTIDGSTQRLIVENKCNVKDVNDSSKLSLNVSRRILQRDMTNQDEAVIYSGNYAITLQSALPIEIYAPYIDPCASVPFCYYEDMEITWNANPIPNQKIFVITLWKGLLLKEPSAEEIVMHADVLDDDGQAVLGNYMFDDMPDEALVALMLVRANTIRVTTDGVDIPLDDVDWDSVWNDIFSNEISQQVYYFASGAMARFTMVLVRNL